MTALKTFLLAVSCGLVLLSAVSAHALDGTNGLSINGLGLNWITMNGLAANNLSLDAISQRGLGKRMGAPPIS